MTRVSIESLAWWIERDGWRRAASQPPSWCGLTVYEDPRGYSRVEVPDHQLAELDRIRDRVYTQVRTDKLRKAGLS